MDASKIHNLSAQLRGWLGRDEAAAPAIQLVPEDLRVLEFLRTFEVMRADQLSRLTQQSLYHIETWLLVMRDQGLVRGTIANSWHLTDVGIRLVSTHQQVSNAPEMVLQEDRQQQLWVSEIIVRIIERARPLGLDSMIVLHRHPIQPDHTAAAVMDVLLSLRFDQAATTPAPTTSQVQNDNPWQLAVEALSPNVTEEQLVAKASVYAAAKPQRWFPLLVTVNPELAAMATTVWINAWPEGLWLVTCATELLGPEWIIHYQGIIQPWTPFSAL